MQGKREGRSGARAGDRGRGSGSVAFLLAQLGAHAGLRFAERLGPLGLAPRHAGILRILGGSSGLSQRELGARLGALPSRVVALVDELEQRGLVERRDDPADRRSYALHLTERGRAMLADVGRVAREHGERLLAALSAEERQQLGRLLERIAADQGLAPSVHPGLVDAR